MKTNRTSWIRRLAIIVGTVFTATQAMAVVPATPAAPVQAEVKATPKPAITMIALGCTRVGTRMVC